MFIKLTENISVAGQLSPADLVEAGNQGFTGVVNNRPDHESPGQPTSAEMQAAAEAAGLRYTAIPVGQAGLDMDMVDAMAAELDAPGPLLAFCRSGTRSTNLWALAEAKRGGDPETIVKAAASGNYDVTGLLPTMCKLAAG